MAAPDLNKVLESHLIEATKAIEDRLDDEIERLDKMTDEDVEALQKRRLVQMKKAQQQKQEWLAAGHGKYEEIPDEKAFFAACKQSKHVACHFYRESTFRCKIIDKHMSILAAKHVEARFLKIDAEKCPFLVERLRIKVLPTVCLAKDGKTVDYVVGFDDLGGVDDFPTEMLEWRIAKAGVINYAGDLLTPPVEFGSKVKAKANPLAQGGKKTIRQKEDSDSDDGNDW